MIVVIASARDRPRAVTGALRSLTPRVSVPQMARPEFFASIPVHIASWMLGGLYLGLVPSIMHSVFNTDSGLVDRPRHPRPVGRRSTHRLPVRVRPGTVSRDPRRITDGHRNGTVTLVSIITGRTADVLRRQRHRRRRIRCVVLGSPAYHRPARRGLTSARSSSAAIYVVSYLSFSLPVVIAGLLVSTAGIMSTAVVYGAVVITAALAGLIWQASSRLARGEALKA